MGEGRIMEIRVIKANPSTIRNEILNNEIKTESKLRVAAYARVSTDKDEQEDSFERQVDYYTRYISSNPKWTLVDIYSDPGITGTRADKRPGFQRMIADCKEHKIDRILCKSLARFARNTVDALNYIRQLKELGVTIFFESQNIDTATSGGDVLLTILAAMAEEESRTISKNVKWSMEKKFQKGEFLLCYTRFLGYTRDENHKMVIVEEEAKIVRRIYAEFISGKPIAVIRKELMDEGIPAPCGGKEWHYTTIYSILHNEKYYGAALMGKTYKPDVLSKKRYKNEGQSQMYYAEGVIETPIISKETYQLAQLEFKRKADLIKNEGFGKSRLTVVSGCFYRKIKCGCCGNYYVRNIQHTKPGINEVYYTCGTRRKDASKCAQGGIKESLIKEAFVDCLNKLAINIDEIKSVVKLAIQEVVVNDPNEALEEFDRQIDALQQQMAALAKRKNESLISDEQYAIEGDKIAVAIEKVKQDKVNYEFASIQQRKDNIRFNEIVEIIDSLNPDKEFDEIAFNSLVDSVLINEKYKITFNLAIGISVTIDKTPKKGVCKHK